MHDTEEKIVADVLMGHVHASYIKSTIRLPGSITFEYSILCPQCGGQHHSLVSIDRLPHLDKNFNCLMCKNVFSVFFEALDKFTWAV